MAEHPREDAEMAVALKREELNRALSYKNAYDAEGHNLCLALVLFKDGSFDVLTAYSNDSAIRGESIRLGLGLVPNVYAGLPETGRFGCDGMAQYHTEPKLLNYLSATSAIRQAAYTGKLPKHSLYQAVLRKQREQAAKRAERLQRPKNIETVTLVTEINCCHTCTKYAIERFRARFPNAPLHTIELGKEVAGQVPARYEKVTVTRK